MSAPAIAADSCPSTASGGLVRAALADLLADFDELLFLCRSAEAELIKTEVELDAATARTQTRELLTQQLHATQGRYQQTVERLQALQDIASRGPASPSLVGTLSAEKAELSDLLRAEQTLTAAIVCAPDWQSPSFLHSTFPAAGRQEGQIRANWNDYKRDRHLDADAYERRYLEAMVDGPLELRTLLTSCGMAAFTTILSFLSLEGNLDRPVVAAKGLYHESRLLLERALPRRIHLIDETETTRLLQAIDRLRPSAVFLDSLSNTKWMPVPELPRVIDHLRGSGTYLVVDNTALSVSCQPFARADESVRLIVFESLLKYAQLGLDRVNAGLIVARADDAESLSHYREHLGTNIADASVHALPRPDRRVLERRLERLQRNALHLAERLRDRVGDTVEVVHPGLASQPQAARELPFRGGCFSIVFREPEGSLRREQALIESAVAEAAKRGVSLHAGSSFGFDTTRIYLTAARAERGDPFVRIAAGTEHRLALEPLLDVLATAVLEVAR